MIENQRPNIHIYAPKPDMRIITVGTCPDCGKRTRFIALHTPWLGWLHVCIRCGRRFRDGEWMPLDFVRGSRQKSIEQAKTRFMDSLNKAITSWFKEATNGTD